MTTEMIHGSGVRKTIGPIFSSSSKKMLNIRDKSDYNVRKLQICKLKEIKNYV